MSDAPINLESGDWKLVEHDPQTGLRRYELQLDENTTIIRTESYVTQDIIDQNREEANDSIGKRFGDGKIVAHVPLNTFFRDLVPAMREGDQTYVKRWLNNSDNEAFRSFRGNV